VNVSERVRHTCKEVVPINAARQFRNPAPILLNPKVQRLIKSTPKATVVELGGGCLRNALYLQTLGFSVTVVEVRGIEDRFPDAYQRFRQLGGCVCYEVPKQQFAWAICTFVIETICKPAARAALIRRTCEQLEDDGRLVMSVRGPRDLLTAINNGQRLSDGFITPGKSFSRHYTPAQLRRFLRSCGFLAFDFLHRKASLEPELVHVLANK
jgi:hypothetical protein